MNRYTVFVRQRVTINTDPQGRCYDGAFISSHEEWSNWSQVCGYGSADDAAESVATFQAINPTRQYEVRS